MLEQTRKFLASHPGAMQVIVLRTAGGRVYYWAFDEPALQLPELLPEQDCAVTHLVCMWDNGQVDVPSYDFRCRLMKLAEENRNTQLLLLSEQGYVWRALAATVPSGRQDA